MDPVDVVEAVAKKKYPCPSPESNFSPSRGLLGWGHVVLYDTNVSEVLFAINLKMEAAQTSETSVSYHNTTQHNTSWRYNL
jgi:hypothetical protein